ncbi:unnamed protein product [Rotaria magnacalcarata]|uniref:Uncharacterized protein n=1 Tax=Rotaria magnacalcarata TaxID=392030 RepID=A0A819VKB1_9BILA|nr:unnamed protein product [Rotaria magnacalcarata]CAF1611595.1 unnamed protein product [Rotaria magnacalcarata]CAF1942722.1 unnamed protein product [Rotaria magnacalcarata]CAF2070014.1 unnamed protein product [Rotaria magnacalcarata]CAF2232257.1 unnamed protein product [Rotaria magnacalcarata]
MRLLETILQSETGLDLQVARDFSRSPWLKLVDGTYRYQYLQNILLPCSVEGEVSPTDDRYLFYFYEGELSDEQISMVKRQKNQ